MTAPNDFPAQERDANDSYVSPQGRIVDMEWRAVFENNPIMCFVVDAAGTVVSVNRSGAEQLGYTVDELIGRSVLDLFHEADRAAVQRHVAACFEPLGHA